MKAVQDERLHEKAEKAIIEHYLNTAHNRLDPEPALAKQLGVSRITVRTALNSLVQKGYLTKRKGIGNFINRSVIQAGARVDEIADFSAQIRQLGHQPSIEIRLLEKRAPDPEIGEKLGCATGEQVLVYLFHYLADGQQAVRIDTQTPERYFKRIPPDRMFQGEQVYEVDFYRQYCGQELSHYLSRIDTSQDPAVNRAFGLPEDRPLVMLRQYHYNLYDECVTYSDIYLNPNIIQLSVFSRYIGLVERPDLSPL